MSPAGPVTCSWLWTQTRGRSSSNSSSPSGWRSARCAAAASCPRSMSSARWKSRRSVVVVVIAGVLAGAADDDLVLLDRHLDGPVAGPVLCVDRAVGDLGIEPQPIPLLAVVERALERRRRQLRSGPASATPAAPAAALGLVLLVGLGLGFRLVLVLLELLLGPRGLGLELGGDQGVVLGAQVDLVVEVDGGRALGRVALRRQVVLALEGGDLGGRHLELVGDPRVGPALADPGADLVQMGAQRTASH